MQTAKPSDGSGSGSLLGDLPAGDESAGVAAAAAPEGVGGDTVGDQEAAAASPEPAKKARKATSRKVVRVGDKAVIGVDGVLDCGQEVTSADLKGGKTTLTALIKRGALIESDEAVAE